MFLFLALPDQDDDAECKIIWRIRDLSGKISEDDRCNHDMCGGAVD